LVVRVTPEARCDVEVVDSQTGRPLTDATVVASRCALFGAPVALRVEPIAGREGTFSVHQVCANSTAIRVSAPGRATRLLSLKVVAPGSVMSRTVPLEFAAGLIGRVVEVGGGPASTVQIAAWPLDESDQDIAPVSPEAVMTDAEGRFAFDGLAAGRWKFVIRTVRYEQPRPDPEGEAHAGRTTTMPDIVLSRGGVLSGSLRDGNGQPVVGRELFALPKEQLADAMRARDRRRSRTDPEGRFEFAGLPPFDWVIVGREDGGSPLGQAHVGWHDQVDLDLVERVGPVLPGR
jgi:hypothetical protein